jgi:hypothetical protein
VTEWEQDALELDDQSLYEEYPDWLTLFQAGSEAP